MQFCNVVALLALGAAASAYDDGFSVPEGAQEGIYSVYRADNGSEVHTLLKLHTSNATSHSYSVPSTSRLMKRDSFYQYPAGSVSCDDHAQLVASDTDAANADIDGQCGDGRSVNGGWHIYSIRKDTVAFFCNFADFTNTCSAGARQLASQQITGACGSYNPGYVNILSSPFYGTLYYSYGYESFGGNKFCGCGTGCPT